MNRACGKIYGLPKAKGYSVVGTGGDRGTSATPVFWEEIPRFSLNFASLHGSEALGTP